MSCTSLVEQSSSFANAAHLYEQVPFHNLFCASYEALLQSLDLLNHFIRARVTTFQLAPPSGKPAAAAAANVSAASSYAKMLLSSVCYSYLLSHAQWSRMQMRCTRAVLPLFIERMWKRTLLKAS
jgi:hypothetical protein